MNWAIAGAGIAAVVVALISQAYLRVRIRQLDAGARMTHEFREVSIALLQREIPEGAKNHIVKLSKVVGTGQLTRKLLRSIIYADLDTPTRRARIESRREYWADYSRDARIAYTQTIFSAILADSYYAGLAGTALRRAIFFVQSSPADIALAIDAMETRILIVGTVDISDKIVVHERHSGRFARA